MFVVSEPGSFWSDYLNLVRTLFPLALCHVSSEFMYVKINNDLDKIVNFRAIFLREKYIISKKFNSDWAVIYICILISSRACLFACSKPRCSRLAGIVWKYGKVASWWIASLTCYIVEREHRIVYVSFLICIISSYILCILDTMNFTVN